MSIILLEVNQGLNCPKKHVPDLARLSEVLVKSHLTALFLSDNRGLHLGVNPL